MKKTTKISREISLLGISFVCMSVAAFFWAITTSARNTMVDETENFDKATTTVLADLKKEVGKITAELNSDREAYAADKKEATEDRANARREREEAATERTSARKEREASAEKLVIAQTKLLSAETELTNAKIKLADSEKVLKTVEKKINGIFSWTNLLTRWMSNAADDRITLTMFSDWLKKYYNDNPNQKKTPPPKPLAGKPLPETPQ